MNREDIIDMAQEAKFATEEWGDGLHHVCVFNYQGSETEITEELERFAYLVASAEREACAGLRKEVMLQGKKSADYEDGFWDALEKYEHLIRARGKT